MPPGLSANDKKRLKEVASIFEKNGWKHTSGFEISRQLGKKEITVVMGARDPAKGQAAADKLKAEEIDAHWIIGFESNLPMILP